jgi:uncharacterized protein (TIGR02996 family)
MRVAPKAAGRVRREFFPEDYALAMRILSLWNTRACAPGEYPSRMHSAVLTLALGSIANLEEYIGIANQDFRDVLLWAEYREGKDLRYLIVPRPRVVPEPVESAFLESIRAAPTDNTHRLVYADWLEERGDGRADYLRLLCDWLASHPAIDRNLIERERELRKSLDRGWLARIRGMPVREKKKR